MTALVIFIFGIFRLLFLVNVSVTTERPRSESETKNWLPIPPVSDINVTFMHNIAYYAQHN